MVLTQKFSVSVIEPLYSFVLTYQEKHHLSSRSEVIGKALEKLQEEELEMYYRMANDEIDSSFDVTIADGLDE